MDKEELRKRYLDGKEGRWITVNGRHIFIEKGESVQSAFKKVFSEKQEKTLTRRDESDILKNANSSTDEWNGENLSYEELGAITNYISFEAYILNDKLRNGKPLDQEDKIMINRLDEALKKAPVYKGTVVRSVAFAGYQALERENFLKAYQKGGIVTADQYWSSTKNGNPYNPFAEIQIYIKSKSGRDISSINKGENEVLFVKGTRFRVSKREETRYYDENWNENRTKYNIFLEEC